MTVPVVGPPPASSGRRAVLLLTHTGRPAAVTATGDLARLLDGAGLVPVMLPEEAEALEPVARRIVGLADPDDPLDAAELVVVVGGDGTILRSAEIVRGTRAPMLGVNLGHVGFLAEAERDDLAELAERVATRQYEVEERMTLEVSVTLDGEVIGEGWAVNEASVEKSDRERMIEVGLSVDARPLTEFGCDGVVLSTPTGSTAYAFSAGGPVVWPELEALLVVPIAAHALFSKPLVIGPDSEIGVDVLRRTGKGGVLWCDGRRSVMLPAGAQVRVRRGATRVRLARLARPPFTDRLVAKFGLPVSGFRGQAAARAGTGEE